RLFQSSREHAASFVRACVCRAAHAWLCDMLAQRWHRWWQDWLAEWDHPLARPALFPEPYTWFIFVSAMDLMLTWVILHYGGGELNGVAATVIRKYDLLGLVAYKFTVVLTVITICEIVGRMRFNAGKGL